MKKSNVSLPLADEKLLVIRITALWALNEAGLGGMLHLVRSPFTGIFVGGTAVILVSLLGFFSSKPAASILKSLVVVLLIKGIVSPQSPLPAYLAVSFQGVLGALLFQWIPSFRISAFVVGTLALLEAALQKLLVLTILFGMPLWKSVNEFTDYVLKGLGLLGSATEGQGALWLAGLYICVYGIVGGLIGWLAGSLPAEVLAASQRLVLPEIGPAAGKPTAFSENKRRRFWQKPAFWWTMGTLFALMAIPFLIPGASQHFQPVWLLARVLAVIGVWYFLLSPVLLYLLNRFLAKKMPRYQEEVEEALLLLPVLRTYLRAAWTETQSLKGVFRIKEWAVRVIAYALMHSSKIK